MCPIMNPFKIMMAALLAEALLFVPLAAFPQDQKASGSNSFYFFVLPQEFSATGQWAPSDPKDRNSTPQEVEIDCFRQSRSCVEAVAEFYIHAHVSVNYPKILQWDANGIVARDDEGVCMSRTIIVNFAEKSISATYSPKTLTAETKKACQFFGMKGTEGATFVVKGSKRWEDSHSLIPAK